MASAAAPQISDRDRNLALAIEHHMAGRLDAAEKLYHSLHVQNSRDGEVLFLLGVLCCDLGLFDSACHFLYATIDLQPAHTEAKDQLIIALNGQAELQEEAGQIVEAEQSLRRALSLAPNDARTLRSLGRLMLATGHAAAAEEYLWNSLTQASGIGFNWLGLAQLQQGKFAAATQSLRQALAMDPELNQARHNLGLALLYQGQLAEAMHTFEQALARDPGYTSARINLANTLRILGRHLEARRHLEQVLEQQPDSIEALNNLGTVLQDQGSAQEALTCLGRAVELAPNQAEIRWNLALTQLLLGDYKRGWANFESRWEACTSLRSAYRHPQAAAWRGETLQGKQLLLWAERGFGDSLQFIRFAQQAAKLRAEIIVEAQPELAELLRSAPGVSQVVARGEELPPYDLHCPLMSLPHLLGIEIKDLSGEIPYLSADPIRTEQWAERLANFSGQKIGLAWVGSSRRQNPELAVIDARRSIPLQLIAPLLFIDGISFFSLQKGEAAAEIGAAGLTDTLHDFSAEWQDFSDTAAFIMNLDLVIGVDTAVAHLAGALGKPVWLLNRHDGCWRWLLERPDSPFYPTLRQFRQESAGDWKSVIEEVMHELAIT
ncbi:beta-barrel assembly-enhancing protease [mine drainage metagenome]|uniref:Beta-barrel assembly-enhancing protease n=1 Tax=mine drainage metagenome TaxID=410659 RepID=A0A1J5RJN4_9ZZZZ